jgi:hypothetical protein
MPDTSDQDGQPSATAAIIRQLMTFAGGAAVTHGWMDNATFTQVVGAFTTLLSVGWSLYSAQQNKKKLSSLTGQPMSKL